MAPDSGPGPEWEGQLQPRKPQVPGVQNSRLVSARGASSPEEKTGRNTELWSGDCTHIFSGGLFSSVPPTVSPDSILNSRRPSQGLSYGNGKIYETTGLYGRSKVIRIDPSTFDVELSVKMNRRYFGEGSAYYTNADGDGRLIGITWKSRRGFIYDPETLETLREFGYTTTAPGNEGWGITYDPSNEEFVVSDGSSNLYFWDRDTLAEKRKVTVTRFDGRRQNRLNELEFMDGLVCCNIWYKDEIICVDPKTGKSVREYDFSSLYPANQRRNENVLNGIALGEDHVLITGKKWDRMYKVTFPDWPTLFQTEGEQSTADDSSNQNDEKDLNVGSLAGGIDNHQADGAELGDDGDGNAESYNFLRTSKGSQTLRVLLGDLLRPPSSSQLQGGTGNHTSLGGPRRALVHLSELMDSDDQILSSCHPLAHILGRAAYRYFGGLDAGYDGMLGTDDARLLRLCNAAYLHGVIEFHLRDVDDLVDLTAAARAVEEEVCDKLANVSMGPWECRHGIGRGIMRRHRIEAERNAIKAGMLACGETSVPDDCANGLWMDQFAVSGNILAMEARVGGYDVVEAVLKGALGGTESGGEVDPSVRERLRLPPLPTSLRICHLGDGSGECFVYAATEYLLVRPRDYAGALGYCTDPSAGIDAADVRDCIRGVGAQCAKENMGDFRALEGACGTLLSESSAEACFEAGLTYYETSSGGEGPSEAGLCDNLTVYKDLCLKYDGEAR